MTNIVVVGSGFAGCTAVRTLRRQGFDGVITVISPKPELFYFPSLIWVANNKRTESDLRINLENFFKKHRVTYRAASVTGIEPDSNKVITDQGEMNYDYLIIGSGGRYIRKLPGIEHAHIACAGWEPTKSWADKLSAMDGGKLAFGFAGNPKEPSAMRGGPVFEFLFGTDTWLRQQGKRDQFELTFFSPAPRPGARMGEKAVDRILAEMSARGISTHLGKKMKGFEPNKVMTEGGEFETDLILFIPGMTGPALAAESGLELTEGGFFKADEFCRASNNENILIAGDAGSFPGPDWKPKQAHMADLQAETAVKNILNQIAGQPDRHTFKTELICIIDSHTTGTMVYRDPKREFRIKGKPMHWAKSIFEQIYLRTFR
ncbi:MAG: NAD(P)/FAD-dependent oxidoreductase [Gammaproteobacteria bacterium]|nr:MAG: NAD(P)/FAD-dependent oxidoreductase [Gammaproteobacteria bacterium]